MVFDRESPEFHPEQKSGERGRPLGLLKLSTLYKAQGHDVRFVRGLALVTRFVPDEIKVTSLFTWAWRPVHPEHRRVILWDNNILGESHWPAVAAELEELGLEVDFNQGLDARLVTEEAARALSRLKIPTIRLAYDFPGMRESVRKAVSLLRGAGLTNRRFRHICCYVLYNYKDKPEDLFVRVRDLLAWGVAAYPMRYQPLNGDFAFEKDSYVSPAWTPDELNMVAAARRVIGYGGAFPPYDGLVKKFLHANGFHDAFGLRTRRDREASPATKRRKPDFDGFELREFAWDLLMMGRDHEFPVQALKRATG